ncbi:MAG: nucleotide sugar epimerase [Desulfuromonas sp. SDB]|nr:MAG: nucleotide sugar epimerase [Desulfuromonas sp. SDB]
MNKILLTGAAGFIGMKTAQQLLEKDHEVVGIDNLNDYYDLQLKKRRLSILKNYQNFSFQHLDIEKLEDLKNLFNTFKFTAVINLAARAGVRYSMENPFVYVTTNVLGNTNLLELSKRHNVSKFILASTSSLYAGQQMPFPETLAVNTPISPYAATKKGAEMMCYAYNYLYNLNITVLRFFTVYGPLGRPDMSIFRFMKLIDEGKPIEVFGDGNQKRDFTYIDDIVEGIVSALKPLDFQIINLGGNKSVKLNYVIELIEKNLGKKAEIIHKDFHKADMKATWADISKARQMLNWQPQISIEQGIEKTACWWKENRDWLKNITI